MAPFREEDAVTVAEIEAAEAGDARDGVLAGLSLALTDLPATAIDGPQADRLRRGQPAVIAPAQAKGIRGDQVGVVDAVLASLHDEPVAICQLEGLKLKPARVFNL